MKNGVFWDAVTSTRSSLIPFKLMAESKISSVTSVHKESCCFTSQRTAFFVVTVVKTSNIINNSRCKGISYSRALAS
jgi:hypothetical protein